MITTKIYGTVAEAGTSPNIIISDKSNQPCMLPALIPPKTIVGTTLFSGVGGSSLSMHNNGINEIGAFDNWPTAKIAFEHNFHGDRYVPYWLEDLYEFSPEDLMRRLYLHRKRVLDVMLITAPCQGFSIAKGKLNPLDPRNGLFLRGIDFIAGSMPKCFIIENVPGMLDERLVAIMNEIKVRFKERLYDYHIKCFKLCALNFNTPQLRERLIYVGYLKEYGQVPSAPPTTTQSFDALTINGIDPQIAAIQVGQSKKSFKLGNQFMNTITASGTDKVILRNGETQMLGRDLNRKFAGFPDWFTLPADISDKDVQKLFGNTIPPPFMTAIISHILSEIGMHLGGDYLF